MVYRFTMIAVLMVVASSWAEKKMPPERLTLSPRLPEGVSWILIEAKLNTFRRHENGKNQGRSEWKDSLSLTQLYKMNVSKPNKQGSRTATIRCERAIARNESTDSNGKTHETLRDFPIKDYSKFPESDRKGVKAVEYAVSPVKATFTIVYDKDWKPSKVNVENPYPDDVKKTLEETIDMTNPIEKSMLLLQIPPTFSEMILGYWKGFPKRDKVLKKGESWDCRTRINSNECMIMTLASKIDRGISERVSISEITKDRVQLTSKLTQSLEKADPRWRRYLEGSADEPKGSHRYSGTKTVIYDRQKEQVIDVEWTTISETRRVFRVVKRQDAKGVKEEFFRWLDMKEETKTQLTCSRKKPTMPPQSTP